MKGALAGLIIFLGSLLGGSLSFYTAPFFIHATTLERPAYVQVRKDIPVSITIPQLGIQTKVEAVGKDDQGRMDVPKDTNNTGWYDLGPAPGQAGNVVIDGHYDSKTGPAVFYRLNDLQVGDTFTVTGLSGNTYSYIIKKKENYADNAFPLTKVFGPASSSHLNLITCNGIFDHQTKKYSDRVVIYSDLQ